MGQGEALHRVGELFGALGLEHVRVVTEGGVEFGPAFGFDLLQGRKNRQDLGFGEFAAREALCEVGGIFGQDPAVDQITAVSVG